MNILEREVPNIKRKKLSFAEMQEAEKKMTPFEKGIKNIYEKVCDIYFSSLLQDGYEISLKKDTKVTN